MTLNQFIDRRFGEHTTDNPDDRREHEQCRVGGVRVRRLRVVNPGHATPLDNNFVAVWFHDKRVQPVGNRSGRSSGNDGESRRGEHVEHEVRRSQTPFGEPVECAQFLSGVAAIGDKSAIDEDAVDRAELTRVRSEKAKSNRFAALYYFRLADEFLGHSVTSVVQDGSHRVRKHFPLRRSIRFGRTVPVQVFLRHVEADAGQWVKRALSHGWQPVQLRARQLNNQHVKTRGVANRIEHGSSDCTDGGNGNVRRGEEMRDQLSRHRFAVRARHHEPIRDRHLVPNAPRELDVTPHGDSALGGEGHDGVIGANPRAHDDEFRVERSSEFDHLVRRIGHGAVDGERVQHREMFFRCGRRRDEGFRPQFPECVRHRESGDPHPHDKRSEVCPVGVPAGETGRAGHQRLAHSR